MPSSAHVVTAYYTLIPVGPTTLRIINDLYDQHDGIVHWGLFYNNIIRVRIAANIGGACADVIAGGTDWLWDSETYYGGVIGPQISPVYLSGSSYQDFDVSGVTLAPDGTYCVFMQTGYWEGWNPPPDYAWIYSFKHDAMVAYNSGADCCIPKWVTVIISEPFGDPEILWASDWLPHTVWP